MLPTFSPVLRLPAPFSPPTPSSAVLKPTKEATPPDKGDLQFGFTSEVTENSYVRSEKNALEEITGIQRNNNTTRQKPSPDGPGE